LCGSRPSCQSRSAFLHIAERRRRNCLAICEAEFVGHKVTSSRSSSSVQRDMAGLSIMAAPASGAMTADPCGDTLAIPVFSTAARRQSDRTLTFDAAAHHLAWLINRDAPYRVKHEPIRRLAFGAPVQRGCASCVSAARTTPLLEGVAPTGGACFLSLPVLLAKLRQRRSRCCERSVALQVFSFAVVWLPQPAGHGAVEDRNIDAGPADRGVAIAR